MLYLSVPYSPGRSLQRRCTATPAGSGPTFSPLFSGSVTATFFDIARPGEGAQDFQSPILRVGHCNLCRHPAHKASPSAFSPLFSGSVTATLISGGFPCQPFSAFSPLFSGSVTATASAMSETLNARLLSVPYSPGRSLQRRSIRRESRSSFTFQSPILRVGHCNRWR